MLEAAAPAANGLERVLSAVLDAVRREAGPDAMTPDEARAVGQAIVTLMAAGREVGGHRLETERDGCAVVRRAMAFIDSNLDDPAMSLTAVAADGCISARHLQRAFAARGTTVTAVIRERRLERARAQLVTRRDVPISHIAQQWGFADLAHFSRLFKAAYGEAPSVYRRHSSQPGRGVHTVSLIR